MAAGQIKIGSSLLMPIQVVSVDPVVTSLNILGRKKYRIKASSFSCTARISALSPAEPPSYQSVASTLLC